MKKIKNKELYVLLQRKRERRNLKRRLKGKRKQKQIRKLLQNKDENWSGPKNFDTNLV